MAKCVITKLKSVATDNNIPKMGVLRIRISLRNTDEPSYFFIKMLRKSKLTLIPDEGSSLKIVNGNGTDLGTTYTLYAAVNGAFLTNGTGYIEIYDKYAIQGLGCGAFAINVNDLAYLENLDTYDPDIRSYSPLDFRNPQAISEKCYGDITGIVPDSSISSFTVAINSVTYDISRLPSYIKQFTCEFNTVGVYCSNANRTGENNNAITTDLSNITFDTVESARNFIIANANCYWEDRENPNIQIRIIESPTYTFDDDQTVLEAIRSLKGKMVWNGVKGNFVVNGKYF